ncbi:hypothetical protein F8M41_012580 [Gigaspora margarita]|uniref:Uncharacterized protein n=1 Tax=Gigaspora margarita TaxID=4874 RepID=A0A8H4EPD3_GIGMA|nr:hypothetical protein F8M41_012580 [Gigaspora margarita]
MSQNVAVREMFPNNNCQRQPQHVIPNFSQIWQEQEANVQNIPQQKSFANSIHIKSTNLTTDSNTSTNEYYQQILTSPNIVPPPQTPNILHA